MQTTQPNLFNKKKKKISLPFTLQSGSKSLNPFIRVFLLD